MSKLPPNVSVIIPAYNAERHLDACLGSVVRQTFESFELIAIDDGSTDETLNTLERWAVRDDRIHVIRHAVNQGVSESRNAGLAVAKSSLVAFLDSDDTWEPSKLALQYHFHQQRGCSFSCTSFWFGRKVIKIAPLLGYPDLLANNLINTSSVMVNTDDIDLQFSHVDLSEDYLQWLAISLKHEIHCLQQPLVTRKIGHGASANKVKMAQQRWKIYRETQQLGLVKSLFYFMAYAITGMRKYWGI